MSDGATSKLRLFIAITIPQPVKAEIQRMQNELKCNLPSKSVRWARPEQFHLTLKFLGNVAAVQVQELVTALGAACAGFGPLQLRARNLGCFPNARAPRVVWVGIEDAHGELERLQASIENRMARFTAEPAPKHFAAHVTLARLGNFRGAEAETLARIVGPASDFGQWTANEVELMRSELSPAGASHSTVAQIALQPGL